MGTRPVSSAPPARLLEEYVIRARRREHGSLATTALRTRSLEARHLLVRAVGPAPLAELLAEARGRAPAGTCALESGPSALADLARVIALQDVLPSDRADGLALLDLALARFGPRRIPPARQGLHAQLALALGHRHRAATLCQRYPAIPDLTRAGVKTDLANPFIGSDGDQATWLRRFQDYFPPPAPVLAGADGSAAFDRVSAPAVPPIHHDELVSVIVTSYRPGTELITSVTSLLQQSWVNLEVVVVDDGSPAAHGEIFARCQALDSRVRVVRLATNGGTYCARNAGLDATRGRIVTFQDSDDWSHPRRLEHQMRPLLDDPTIVATTSAGLRATPDLMVTLPGHRTVGPIASSLMFRRDTVVRRIGYFDRVRKAADTEYQRRIIAAFGDRALRHLSDVYSLIRVTPASLSRSDFGGGGWVHPARVAYRSAYTLWHQRIRLGRADPRLERSAAARRFPAPAYLAPAGQPADARRVDVVLVGDWRGHGDLPRAAWQEMRALADHGLRVAVVHVESFRFPTRARRGLWQPIQELVNDGTVWQLDLADQARASLVIVRSPSVLQFAPRTPGGILARQVAVQVAEAPWQQDGSGVAYEPAMCAAVARTIFGTEPSWWCPETPVRDQLVAAGVPLAAAPPPAVTDVGPRWPARDRFRGDRPVIGRRADDGRLAWPADRDALLAAYPDSPECDVRLAGGAEVLRELCHGRLPPNWLVYREGEVDTRSFLWQLDFYVDLPHPARSDADAFAVLEAMAAGCVAVVRPELSRTFQDAAVYCREAEVPDLVAHYFHDRDAYLRKSRRAMAWVRAAHGRDAYVRYVTSACELLEREATTI